MKSLIGTKLLFALVLQGGICSVFANQVTIQYYDDSNCQVAGDFETDPIGTCTSETDGSSSFATKNADNTFTFKVYTAANCAGNPRLEVNCGCDASCCPYTVDGVTYGATVTCPDDSAGTLPAVQQVTIQYYDDTSCISASASETDTLGVCETQSSSQSSFAVLEGSTVSLKTYTTSTCDGSPDIQASCGCSDTCCIAQDSEGNQMGFSLTCPVDTSTSASTSTRASFKGSLGRLMSLVGATVMFLAL